MVGLPPGLQQRFSRTVAIVGDTPASAAESKAWADHCRKTDVLERRGRFKAVSDRETPGFRPPRSCPSPREIEAVLVFSISSALARKLNPLVA